MWDELILPAFIPCLVQRSSVISASVFTSCTGSIHFTEREGLNYREGMRSKVDIVTSNASCLNDRTLSRKNLISHKVTFMKLEVKRSNGLQGLTLNLKGLTEAETKSCNGPTYASLANDCCS